MEMNEIIERAKENIRKAVLDYGRHTDQTAVMDDISAQFIARLATDSSRAKQELRELFSQSPAWDSELDAMVINGTRTHDPDYSRIKTLAFEILALRTAYSDSLTLCKIVEFFTAPGNAQAQEQGIEAMARVAPKAYAPGKKLSRVFKAVCQALGAVDETAGSEFQRLYAQFADELTAKKISFKMFVSINPAHFLTMSNPKNDRRGDTLTSCHSFNSTQYDYNVGCVGYARDKYSFIVFTVADPTNRESLNNRKTTRQIFAYRPGNGLLLQSRFYNTSGGVYGAAEDSKLYRDLIQREISMIERVPNLWKTHKSHDPEYEHCAWVGRGFGGYPDWTYSEFDGKVSIRADHEKDYKNLEIGTYGLCVRCADTTDSGVYCLECKDSGAQDEDMEYCELCEMSYDADDMCLVHGANGGDMWVCFDCRDSHFAYCDCCGEYYPNEQTTWVAEVDGYYCRDCLTNYCEECDECGEWYLRDRMYSAVNEFGDECWICPKCRAECYYRCDNCEMLFHDENLESVYITGGFERIVCRDCAEKYVECEDCGRKFESGVLQDGRCPECYQENREEESA